MDQIPIEEEDDEHTINPMGAPSCFRKGRSRQGKRVLTLQLTVRCEGDQLMQPILIFKAKPSETSVKVAPWLKKTERQHYDQRVLVYFDPKAYCSAEVMKQWFTDWVSCKRNLPAGLDMIQFDGYKVHIAEHMRRKFALDKTKVILNPGDCTDLCSVVDDMLGQFMKGHMNDAWDNLMGESLESLNYWTEDASAGEKRIKWTEFAGDAWDALKSTHLIKKAFQHCGLANDKLGRENHLIRVMQCPSYVPPKKEDPKMNVLTEEEQKEYFLKDTNLKNRRNPKRKRED